MLRGRPHANPSVNRTRHRLLILALGVAAMSLCMASLAWACAPQAYISVSPSHAAPGQQVTVVGREFAPGGRVELRWKSPSGPVLGTATGAEFSRLLEIPVDTAPGYYTVVAVGYATDGQSSVPVRQAPASIEVDAPPAPAQAESPAPAPAAAQAQSPAPPTQAENPPAAPSVPAARPGQTPRPPSRKRRRHHVSVTTSGGVSTAKRHRKRHAHRSSSRGRSSSTVLTVLSRTARRPPSRGGKPVSPLTARSQRSGDEVIPIALLTLLAIALSAGAPALLARVRRAVRARRAARAAHTGRASALPA